MPDIQANSACSPMASPRTRTRNGSTTSLRASTNKSNAYWRRGDKRLACRTGQAAIVATVGENGMVVEEMDAITRRKNSKASRNLPKEGRSFEMNTEVKSIVGKCPMLRLQLNKGERHRIMRGDIRRGSLWVIPRSNWYSVFVTGGCPIGS